MKIAAIQFFPWDKDLFFQTGGFKVKRGDMVVAESEFGRDLGRVVFLREVAEKEVAEMRTIERLAAKEDRAHVAEYRELAPKTLKACRKFIAKHKLPMKLVDVFFSLDGSRLTFSFVAEERIDFRALVRDLTRFFQKSIRLQQIGSRDECRAIGGYGPCGRPLCCHNFLCKIESITTEIAREQQMVQRGSERISGVCGRLMCCLNFERELYEETSKKMPSRDVVVDTRYGQGKVVGQNIIRQSVMVQLPDSETPVEIKLTEIKKSKTKNLTIKHK